MSRHDMQGPIIESAYEHPRTAILLAESFAWFAGLSLASLLRFDFDPNQVSWLGVAVFAALGAMFSAAADFATGTLRGRYRIASFEEAQQVATTTLLTAVLLFGIDLLLSQRTVPLGAVLAGAAFVLLIKFSIRGVWRIAVERSLHPMSGSSPLLIFGAGEAGTEVVTALLRTPDADYCPVALLDDERTNRVIRGVPVVGQRGQIADAAARFSAKDLLIAIPSASNALVREIAAEATDAGLRLHILPRVDRLVDGSVTIGDIRELTESDLLERGENTTDLMSVARYLDHRVVLVTGAGGSIGSEICRQLSRHGPSRIVMLDRDENGLQATQLSMDGHGLLQNPDLIVGDIRDSARVLEVFRSVRPDVVFHAAALKHLPLLEMHPDEGYKTNVLGTLNLLEAASEVGVQRFVNVSTDKAADPASVLGQTKRAAERLTAYVAETTSTVCLSVRFGNVLGSSGSVLPTFRHQIESGGPVTVTHPDTTRYFMTIPEAVQLVVQAGAIGDRGDVMVLDMGEPVRILDMARRLVANADADIKIVFTGLRPGEKLHEVLFGVDEILSDSSHPLISRASVPPIRPHELSSEAVLRHC